MKCHLMNYDHELEIHHHQPLFHGMTCQVSLLKWFEERMPYLERYFKTSELDNLHSTLGNIHSATVRYDISWDCLMLLPFESIAQIQRSSHSFIARVESLNVFELICKCGRMIRVTWSSPVLYDFPWLCVFRPTFFCYFSFIRFFWDNFFMWILLRHTLNRINGFVFSWYL